MAKDINLTSSDWTDIIFEGKNKDYGAYKMRQTSAKRQWYALFVVFLAVVFVAFLPSLLDAVKVEKATDNISEQTVLADISELEEKVKEQDLIKQQEVVPPPPLKTTVKFTPPVITDAEDIKPEEELKSQDQLMETKVQISVADVQGTDDKNGIDIADLKDNKVVVQEEEEKPFVGVEQQPEFPGGRAALNAFLSRNLRYPAVALENEIEGRVTLRFVVSKTGKISNIEVLRGIDPACDREAVRVVSSMPDWVPGKQNGRNVPVLFILPVVFRINR